MEYVIGVILVIIIVIIAGLLFRKRLYDTIDYYENWKIDIMGRNIAAKLTRVKTLNIEGEAKESFDGWKEGWDAILTKDLANIEELLFDAEQSADRFRIASARKYLHSLEEKFIHIEEKIDRILTEIDKLINTEEETRKEVERIQPRIEELREKLLENRSQYERAYNKFEAALDDINSDIGIYNELIDAGTYSEAKEVVENIQQKLLQIEGEMDQFPDLFKQCKYELPEQLDTLYKGYKEMEEAGYPLDHLNVPKRINDYQVRLLDFVMYLEEEGTDKVQNSIPDIEDSIQEMYKQLEEEAIDKNYVESKTNVLQQELEKIVQKFNQTEDEVNELKVAYQFVDADMKQYESLKKIIEQLQIDEVDFKNKLEQNDTPFSKLRDNLEGYLTKLQTLEKDQDDFKKRIKNLRKDEVEAREQINWMTDEMNKVRRKLRQSNLPGIPKHILTMLEDSVENNNRVLDALEEQPLDIVGIQKTLAEAKSSVENVIEQTNAILDQANLAELVIQYANRYRSQNPVLAAKLLEAEQQFRNAEYELALEQAAQAVEEVEPGALEKIERLHTLYIAT